MNSPRETALPAKCRDCGELRGSNLRQCYRCGIDRWDDAMTANADYAVNQPEYRPGYRATWLGFMQRDCGTFP